MTRFESNVRLFPGERFRIAGNRRRAKVSFGLAVVGRLLMGRRQLFSNFFFPFFFFFISFGRGGDSQRATLLPGQIACITILQLFIKWFTIERLERAVYYILCIVRPGRLRRWDRLRCQRLCEKISFRTTTINYHNIMRSSVFGDRTRGVVWRARVRMYINNIIR